MKRVIPILAASLLVGAVMACNTAAPTATPDTQATIEAAVSATAVAQNSVQATIDAAVQATSAAASPPTPAAEYVTMTEEELATLIDQAVVEATAASEECGAATAEVTADNTITQEEVDEVVVYVAGTEEAIAYAEELIYAYYDLYGELATETLVLLQAIEQDLAALSDEAAAINDALQEVNTALEQGLTLAEETITQLESAAQAASTKAAEIQVQNQEWIQDLQVELENRAATALAIQPDNVAADRRAAILSAFDYVDAVREGLADNKISRAELAHIAQLGANASAGLNAHGNPPLQRLSGSINDITGQLARGQASRAQTSLGSLESALGTRPSRP
ncbi:MAG: hypothetical protein KKC18_15245 [Chloroflexi bacterium]|nr:hypothetical protein [Chloroflexota bacterium]